MPRISPQYEQSQMQKIVEGAALVFSEYGYRQTTIDLICQAVHLSKGAIYTYFDCKEDLFVAVMQTIYERRFTYLSSAYHAQDAVQVKLEKIAARLGSLMDDNDFVYLRLSLEGFLESSRIPRLHAAKTESYDRFHALILGLLREGQTTGEISPDLKISSVATVLLALSDGLMLHSLVKDRGIDPDHVRGMIKDTFSQLLYSKLD